MVELQEAIQTHSCNYRLCKSVSRQHLGMTTQFPSQGMGWPRAKVYSLAKWIAVSGDQTAIACVAFKVDDHYTTVPISYKAYLVRKIFHTIYNLILRYSWKALHYWPQSCNQDLKSTKNQNIRGCWKNPKGNTIFKTL